MTLALVFDIDGTLLDSHGAGKQAFAKAIAAVFGGRGQAPPVSSTKSMIGHAIAAAGNVELLAVLAALRHQALPPTINLDRPDPECDLDYVPHQAREARRRGPRPLRHPAGTSPTPRPP